MHHLADLSSDHASNARRNAFAWWGIGTEVPPPLPKSSSKSSIKAKALNMLKLGDKIIPDAAQREMSMKGLSSMLHVGKTPSKEASMKHIPVIDASPLPASNSIVQQQQQPLSTTSSSVTNGAATKTPVKETSNQAAAAFELLIADMSKLRVQLRKASEDLEAEKLVQFFFFSSDAINPCVIRVR